MFEESYSLQAPENKSAYINTKYTAVNILYTVSPQKY